MAVVVLDPGHGAETAGKCAPDGSFLEHEFNLDLAMRLKKLLERYGVEVILTRCGKTDISLADRVKTANSIPGLNLFVSLHSNASGNGKTWTSPKGFGVYTSAGGEGAAQNRAAKAVLQRAKEKEIAIWGGGLFHNIGLYVLKYTVAPAILIEHGFHTNKNEVLLLKEGSYREKLAEVDAKGILDYLGICWLEPEAWYEPARKWALSKGITDGGRPEDLCTHAEIWEMLYQLHNG